MIVFRRIQWSNFLSTGDVPITIALDQNPTTLIIGTNGSGKSTLLDALSYVLFGKPHRNIKIPQLVNSVNGKHAEVQIEFSIGTEQYRIVRGLKPSIFEIWKNGTMINQDSHARDYQKVLENNILKLNKKSFSQIVILGAGNFVPFMQMPLWDRRDVIEELLDISIFSKMNTLLKEKMAKLKDHIRDTENELTVFKEKVVLQQKHLNELQEIDASQTNELKQEIADLEKQIKRKKKDLTELDAEYEANQARVDLEFEKANTNQNRFDGFYDQIKTNKGKVEEEITFYQDNRHCPTCEQDLDPKFCRSKLEASKIRLIEFTKGLSKLDVARSKHRTTELKAAQDAVVALKKLHISTMTMQASINGLQTQLSGLQDKLATSEKKIDTDAAQTELAKTRTERDRLADLKAEQANERTYHEVLLEMLKDTGIKTKIIRQYIPLMNKCINQYLQILDFFVSFHLDDSFEETIRSRHRDDFSYASFSEGEKMRINLAILFTWRQIAKVKNHNNTNLLLLDETFDSSLDSDGVDNLLKILSTLSATNVFVITHKPEGMVEKMVGKLEFEKKGLFSQLK